LERDGILKIENKDKVHEGMPLEILDMNIESIMNLSDSDIELMLKKEDLGNT